MTGTLSPTEAAAARKYGSDYAKAQDAGRAADKVMTAKQELAAARPASCAFA